MTLSRVLRDKRSWVAPLVVLAIANAAAYLLGVLPLRARVAAAEQRASAAAADLRVATAQHERARATVDGRGHATQQLKRFYEEVLPRDQATARRLTYLDLARMASAVDLRVARRAQKLERERNSDLVRLETTMVLEGRYDDVREFLYEIETASDFVVVDEVALARSAEDEERGRLVLTLGVSTYFRQDRGR